MISIKNLSFNVGGRVIYDNASLHIKPNDKIGLIGANGTGKSTLLRLIAGEFTPNEGEITYSNNCSIGFLNQDLMSYESSQSILNVVLEAFNKQLKLQAEMDKILSQIELSCDEQLLNKLAKLQEEFALLDGYSIQSKAEKVLEGLGFDTTDFQKPLNEFSGGWRMRVMLAKLLLMQPSLLLLDEPTNHLDIPSIQWLETYLEDYEGALVVVSHDRFFLEQVCDAIVEVSQKKLHYYPENYSYYLEEKQKRIEIQKNAYENQQAYIKQTEKFIKRFQAKASKASQVQSRIKALKKLKRIEEVADEQPVINFTFKCGTSSGKNVLELNIREKKFNDKIIFSNTAAKIYKGDHIGLIGANGKGKSTLLKLIAGLDEFNGERRVGYNVKIAYYAQHQLDSLNVENTIFEELLQSGSNKTEAELRTVLGCFLFSGEDVFKKIKVLSGGEKSRVALAKVLISDANFLLLDEPTNHLDIQSVNVLTHALRSYQGSFVLVSHDRHFISQVANKIWYIEGYAIKEYPGTYEEYELWKVKQDEVVEINHSNIINKKSDCTRSTVDKQGIKNTSLLQKKIAQVESEISLLENKIIELDKAMCENQQKFDSHEVKLYCIKREQLQQELNEKQEQWFKLYEELEQ